ncbi:hypothetical protein D1816_01135 [Aquimarina sp. AD10]|uniref:hypothetical protein n=1 Tax=Aquimarina sp. AD10 TaxID=1714849 RepID=UPI000E4A8B19|nr:hypothetical protein [Aquimarina sp. AD10]AXT59011.1 hypothetical protein D1816_01135 [Aquimarina sp. AD10]RKM95106.1 hypothetical protein D7033_17600 [Aquimarina sp. AD10]
MNTKILILLLCSITLGFTTNTNENDEYTYLLTISSTTDQIENFNLKIISKTTHNSKSKETLLENIKTPFEKKLDVGSYEIIIFTNKPDNSIKGVVSVMLNGEKWGWSQNYNKESKLIKLHAGPNGETGTVTD